MAIMYRKRQGRELIGRPLRHTKHFVFRLVLDDISNISGFRSLAELHSFRLFKHKEIFLVVCIVSRWKCGVLLSPV